MGSFGERLQREREMRGITLEEIANATKIGTRALRALEQEEFGKLPGGIFNKGFVRAYARYLGINEEQAVADYMTALGGDANLSDEATLHRLEPALRAEKERLTAGRESEGPKLWTLVLVVLVIAACAAFGWNAYSKRKQRIRMQIHTAPAIANSAAYSAPSPVVSVAVPPEAAGSPAAATVAAPAGNSPAPVVSVPELTAKTGNAGSTSAAVANPNNVPEDMVVLVRARQKSWLSILADGKPVMKEVLQAGGETSVRAKKQVVLTAGNAGGVEVLLNGKVLAPMGPADEVKTVVIGPDGMHPVRARTEPIKTEN